MKYYRNVIIRLNKNFKRRKTANPYEWGNYRNVIELCNKYGFNIRIYIKYCFLNRLIQHGRGHALSDISYLTHFQQLSSYAKNKAVIDKNYSIYMNVLKSVLRIKDIVNRSGSSSEKVLKDLFSSGNLSNYVISGTISKFFLALIPNSENVIHDIARNNKNEEIHVIDGLCESIKSLRSKSIDAMRMFWPEVLKRTIVEICSD